MSLSQPESQEPGFQILALFNGFPSIDAQRLASVIDGVEEGSEPCRLGNFRTGRIKDGGQRIGVGNLSLGGLAIALVVHDWPMPAESAEYTVGVSNWSHETKAFLSGHDCFALVTCAGQAEPIEKILALYKVGLALIDQGAIGVINEAAWSCYPAEVFEALKLPGTWESLETEGVPPEFLVGTVRLVANDKKWLVSKGHHLFGLPELAFEVHDDSQVEGMSDIFANIFHYLYEHGPVIEVGHTVEIEGGSFLSFSAPSEDQEFLDSPGGTLVIELEDSVPK